MCLCGEHDTLDIMSDMVKFRVKRSDPEADRSGFQDYEFPYKKGMTVLEGLWYIVDRLDGSLGFRYSCRGAVCGSCAMRINEEIRLACETQIATLLPSIITLEPLPYMTVIRDLIVDMEPFFAKYKSIKPFLMPGTPPPERERPQTASQQAKVMPSIDCILCSCCHASCTVTGTDPE